MRRKAQIFDKIALFGCCIVLFAASGSDQDFKIRAKVDLVVVPVTVKGSGDKLITGLTKDHFIISKTASVKRSPTSPSIRRRSPQRSLSTPD